MFFFDFALMTILGAGAIALVIGMVALITVFTGRERAALVDGDCRDTRLIMHGEGARDCD